MSPSAQGTWTACTFDDDWGLDASGELLCCNGDTPKLCSIYDGVDQDFDGGTCLPAGASCKALQKNSSGTGWNYCLVSQNYGVDGNGQLHCCGDTIPVFCGESTVYDGDAAYAYSKAQKPPVSMCGINNQTCEVDSQCVVTDGKAMKCKFFGTCKHCIAAAMAFDTVYPGGCWPQGTYCDKLVKCGGQFHLCNGNNCYCWDGKLSVGW
jgi:hypothetical protein